MLRTTLISAGLFVLLIVVAMTFGPTPPHDYLEIVRDNITSSQTGYDKRPGSAGGTTYSRWTSFTIQDLTEQQLVDALTRNGFSGYSPGRVPRFMSRKGAGVAFGIRRGGHASWLVGSITQELDPKQVAWVKMMHWGRDPF
jgi:hypothetical protein